MYIYEESGNGEEYIDSKGHWHVKPSVIDRESRAYMLHERFHPANMFHKATQKSNIYANEISSVGIRQELKKNEKAHRELLEHIKKLGEYYNN